MMMIRNGELTIIYKVLKMVWFITMLAIIGTVMSTRIKSKLRLHLESELECKSELAIESRVKLSPDELLKPGEIIAGKYMLMNLFNYETNIVGQLRWVASDITDNYLFILKFYYKSLSSPGANPKIQEF